MAHLFLESELPRYQSTRDTRDRLDLAKEGMPFKPQKLHADRIIYHPGDTAAKHYHTDSYHLFYVLAGEGLIHVEDGSHRLRPGSAAVVEPNEIHWFENDTDENFVFVEFWAPPPGETIWVTDDI